MPCQYENRIKECIRQEEWELAYDYYNHLIRGFNVDNTIIKTFTGFHFFYNYLHPDENYGYEEYESFVQTSSVRRSLHVGPLRFNDGADVKDHMIQDFMSVAPWLSSLLDSYDVLVYNDQLDVIVAYPVTVNYLRKLNFSGAQEYERARRDIWRVDGEVAGYVKQVGRLTEALGRNAGHIVPVTQPKWAMDLITRFTHRRGYTNHEPGK